MEKKQKTFYIYPIGAPGGKTNRKEEAFENIMRFLQRVNNAMIQINRAQKVHNRIDSDSSCILVKFKNIIDKKQLKFLKRKISSLSQRNKIGLTLIKLLTNLIN